MNQNYQNNVDFGYSYSYTNLQTTSKGRFNGIEFVTICICILSLILALIVGFWNQNNKNRDLQKQYDMENLLIPSLVEFYENSGSTENRRFYPKAVCSQNINEVDYEMILRQYLSGQMIEVETHTYLPSSSFPRDKSGIYSQNFNQRKVEYRCPEKLNFRSSAGQSSSGSIYSDFPSCNFRRRLYNNCYLYTSTSSGDKFELAYFSEGTGCFVVYSKFRNNSAQRSIICT